MNSYCPRPAFYYTTTITYELLLPSARFYYTTTITCELLLPSARFYYTTTITYELLLPSARFCYVILNEQLLIIPCDVVVPVVNPEEVDCIVYLLWRKVGAWLTWFHLHLLEILVEISSVDTDAFMWDVAALSCSIFGSNIVGTGFRCLSNRFQVIFTSVGNA